MSTVLPNLGIIIPTAGQDPWGADVNSNWQEIDDYAGTVNALLHGVADDDELLLFMDQDTPVENTPDVGHGFGAVKLPAGSIGRLRAKWKPRPTFDASTPVNIVLALGADGSAAEAFSVKVTVGTVLATFAVDAATLLTETVAVTPAGLKKCALTLVEFSLPTNCQLAAITIERLVDFNANGLYLWGAWMRWTNV